MSPASDETTPAADETPDAASEWAGEAGADEAGAEKAPAKKAPAKAAKADAEEAGADKAKADKAGADKAKADKVKSDKVKADAAKARADARAELAKTAEKAVKVADLPQSIFDAQVNLALMHQVVVAQQAAARQGTHAVKTRGDVRGGGKKPYRQKGTGRARQGSIRAPQFTGGGVVHGPVPRSYVQKTPKKMKAAALRGALSDRARHGFVHVVSYFSQNDLPRTQEALAVLHAAAGAPKPGKELLVVVERTDQATWKSLRNVAGVHLIDPGQLNTYDVLVSDQVVFTEAALASFVARASGQEGDEQ